jgi:hypothetical protein
MTNLWTCPGGGAAAGRPGPRFRDAFLGTVAAGALSLAFGGPALACTLSGGGTIETCTGNQSTGIAIVPPTTVTTLDVNNLAQAITPASGTSGISFISAGAITITSNTGAFGITTAGDFASGIYARARGGGAVTVTSTGNITTAAHGIYAYALGAVTVTSKGDITTRGGNTVGIYAKSLGAGAVTVTSTGNITATGGFGIAAESYGIGAGAGAVTVTSTGNIASGADGILAEGNSVGAALVTSSGSIATAGSGADGIRAEAYGVVTVTSTGNIVTAGSGADGIFALSSGLGPVTVTSTGNITTAGNGAVGIQANGSGNGAVTVTSTGNIATAGAGATGIVAESNGAVTVTSTGNITTAGANANGIVGSSASSSSSFGPGSGPGGPISITIKSGTVSGGTGTGAGIDIQGGTTNTLTNRGTVMALSGLAIEGDTGLNTVNNFGTVTGNVILGSNSNAFNNMAGAVFNAGPIVNLGPGNTLTNSGTLSLLGGAWAVQTTTLTGNLVQTATGRLLTDVNLADATSDRINVSGTTSLAGAVQVQVV